MHQDKWLEIVIKTPLSTLELTYHFLWQQVRGIAIDKEGDDFILNAYIKDSDKFLKRLEKLPSILKRKYLIKQIRTFPNCKEDKLSHFIIMPSHFDLPGIPIILEPATAFGTGSHPTTIYCLKLLYELYKDFIQLPEYVLDAGTGTGILAIAAARLGAKQVLAIDISHDAVSITERNVALNHLANIKVQSLCITKVEGKFDLILANLDEALLKRIPNKLAELLNNRGWLIISGMTVPDDKVIIPLFLKNGLRLIKSYNKVEWCAALLKK
jgi:ribosomal protein L11 methylase PrmA